MEMLVQVGDEIFIARKDRERIRTVQRRAERAEARASEHDYLATRRQAAPSKPLHCRRFEEFSREWFEACDRAFQAAMEAAGYLRRIGKTEINSTGSTR